MLAHPDTSDNSCGWFDNVTLVAWSLAQPAFSNVLFDVEPTVRTAELGREVLRYALRRLSARDVRTADTPVESDDPWRESVLRVAGFTDSGDSVIHLATRFPVDIPGLGISAGYRVQELGGDRVGKYVAAHRAAFGTEYVTSEVRHAWQEEAGYRQELDLVLVDEEDGIAAFAVSYLHGRRGEIGTVGVLPEQRGQGLSHIVVAAALDRLKSLGADSVTMSTSSTNGPMLATARRFGFVEIRRTSWWSLASIGAAVLD